MLRNLYVFLLLIVISPALLADPGTLKLGLYPYVSAGKLIKHQRPVHQFLRKQLGREIELVTAQDFIQFAARVKKSDYDLIYAAPHFARYCEREGLYTPLAMTQTRIQGVYLVNRDSTLQSLQDLRNRELTLSTVGLRFGLLHQLMKEQTRAMGIDKLRYVEARTNNNSIYSVLKQQIDVALTGIKIWKNLDPQTFPQLRKIGETPAVPGFIIMAKPALAEQIKPFFANVEKDFSASLAGKKYLFGGLQACPDGLLLAMDPYTRPFEQFQAQ